MTTTAQALSGTEQTDYLKIQKAIEAKGGQELEDLSKLQAKIVNDIVSANSSIQGDIANQVRAKILNSSKYTKYLP